MIGLTYQCPVGLSIRYFYPAIKTATLTCDLDLLGKVKEAQVVSNLCYKEPAVVTFALEGHDL